MAELPHSPDSLTAAIFLSYSRRDRDFAIALYAELEALGFRLWRDVHDIAGGEPFWEAIKEAIDACETLVLCMSPDALKSEFVQREWHYARQQGRRVIPVVAADVDFGALPRWMGRVDWKDFREGVPERETVWASFIRTLNTPYEERKVPFMVDRLPEYFVERPDEFDALRDALISREGAVAITAALRGAGGYGKTTLAMALCHDNAVRGAFDDGILWVTLGEKPSEIDLIGKALDLVFAITGEKPPVGNREAVKAELAKAIGDRYMLLVIDDLWRKHDADIFLTGGENSAVLITTRYDAKLPDMISFRQTVDAMQLEQAVKLLAWRIEHDESHRPALEALAGRLGEWAVMLRLVNATLRKRIERGDTLVKALDYANKALTRKGLVAFDSDNPEQRTDAVRATLQVSVDLLSGAQQEHFGRLAIFPEGADIPFTTLERLWDLDDFDTEEAAEALYDASLLLDYDLETRRIRLHNVVRQYLVDEHRANLAAWQAAFVDALGDLYALPDGYAWRNIAYHLLEAGHADTLRALLLDFRWLQAKFDATDLNALLSDCNHLKDERPFRLVRQALTLSRTALAADRGLLAGQVLERTWAVADEPEIRRLRASVPDMHRLRVINPQPVLAQAGGYVLALFEGHTGSVQGALALADGSLLSWADDRTLRRWDPDGTPLAVFEGHTKGVRGALVLADGSLLSWAGGDFSRDYTLRHWSSDGTPLTVFEGHTNTVNGALALADGTLLSWSDDGTLRRWAPDGTPLAVFKGHTGMVRGALALANGSLLSWSWDGTLRRWDPGGTLLAVFKGHARGVTGALALADGSLLSWSDDSTLRCWDTDGAPLAVFEGHTWPVTGALALADGTLLSWAGGDFSEDYTLRRWALDGRPLAVFEGHTGWVMGALALADGTLLSWAEDGTLRRWDPDGMPLAVFEGHKHRVRGALALADGTLLSWAADRTLRRWDPDGTTLAVFEAHTSNLNGALALADGTLLSWSDDGTLRRWDPDGTPLAVFEGHTGRVRGARALADGSLLSWAGGYASKDHTLRRWAPGGTPLTVFVGHTRPVRGALALADGSLLSWADDRTLRRWDPDGTLLALFKGHADEVRGALALADGSLLSWAGRAYSKDHTLRRWALDGTTLAVFEGHTGGVRGALALADGSLLSWADDRTLRRWDPDGTLLTVFLEHTGEVRGALALADCSLLSWGDDPTLRRWDLDGTLLAVFEGHTGSVQGALALADGSLLSWGDDRTLRRWGPDGTLLAVFEGHTDRVWGALALADGSLLSWSRDHTLRRWDPDGTSLAVLEESYWGDKARIFAWARTQGFDANLLFAEENEPRVCGGRAARRGNQVYVYDPASGETLARFVGDAAITCLAVLSGDVIAAGDESGRVLFLRWVR